MKLWPIFDAIVKGWEPANPNAIAEFHRSFDWEKPGDGRFLDSLLAEAVQWLADNYEVKR